MRHLVTAFLLSASPAAADTLTHLGTFVWDTPSVVGLSGLEVSDDGTSFATISDRGWYLAGDFLRTDGQISGINLRDFLPIRGIDGLPVSARRVGDWADAEGLAVAPDGRLWIGFERWAHVSAYDAPDQTGQWIKDHPTFAAYDDNRQIEALALHPDGTLYAFAEQPLDGAFPVYRLDGKTWTIAGTLPPQDRFALVGADFDVDGRLYLLERKLALGLWWQNRVRRVDLTTFTSEILWTGGRGDFGNLEGLALWHDADGLRLTLVSDNNGDRSDPTHFVEFRLNPD